MLSSEHWKNLKKYVKNIMKAKIIILLMLKFFIIILYILIIKK